VEPAFDSRQRGASDLDLPTLLVVNPNTSAAVTQAIETFVRNEVGAKANVVCVRAPFGLDYLNSRASVAIAGHAVLDAVARARAEGVRPQAILLACFGDPAIEALRELFEVPVTGFAEAGLLAAAGLDGPFLVATRGLAWLEMLVDLAGRLRIQSKVAGYEAIDAYGDDPVAIADALTRRARELGARRVVLGGAGLIPILGEVARLAEIQILDPHRIAVSQALDQAGSAPPRRRPAHPPSQALGLSEHLSNCFAR